MSSKEEKPELYSVTLGLPHTTQTINSTKVNKQLVPLEMATGKARNLAKSKKLDHEIKVKHNPLKKKALKNRPFQKAFGCLLQFPSYVEQPETAAILLLLILLSQVAYLLVGILPPLPAVLLSATSTALSPVLNVLLCAIQGPPKWRGDKWKLRRPWVIHPRISPRETKPSISVLDYIGGTISDWYFSKPIKFCFPYINSAFALMPGILPSVNKQITAISPLSLPIIFKDSKSEDNRTTLSIDAGQLASYDVERIQELKNLSEVCYLGIMGFLRWFCQSKELIQNWKNNIVHFRPVKKNGRFTHSKSDLQTELLCAALSLLEKYLYFASDEVGWITEEQAVELLLYYWRLVLPESAPQKEKEPNTQYTYNDPRTFYRFLTEYFLPTYQKQILQGRQGSQGTMGLIRPLDGLDYIIIPRTVLLETYSNWLKEQNISDFDLSTAKSEAAVQRSLLDAGIPFKHEGNNPATWRYPFYGKDKKTPGGGMVNCMALPLSHLPENVQTILGTKFGGGDFNATPPSPAEAAPDSRKGVKTP